MNTADAILAMRSGDWHGLVNALDVDERDTVTLPSGGNVDVVRIGQSVLCVPSAESGVPILVNTFPCGHESCAHDGFVEAVGTGRETAQMINDAMAQATALNFNAPMGFSV